LLESIPGTSGLWVLGEPQKPNIIKWHWPATTTSSTVATPHTLSQTAIMKEDQP
jgi:hypothetical protein